MTSRKPLNDRNVPTVYSLGSIHLHIIAHGGKRPQVVIHVTRQDRSSDDKFWNIIGTLSPAEYRHLDKLIAEAIAKFKTPGELYVSSDGSATTDLGSSFQALQRAVTRAGGA